MDSTLDKTHKISLMKKPLLTKGAQTHKLSDLFAKFNLLDIWRLQHLKEKDFTFFSEPHQIHT